MYFFDSELTKASAFARVRAILNVDWWGIMKSLFFCVAMFFLGSSVWAQSLFLLSPDANLKIDLDNFRKLGVSGRCDPVAAVKVHLTDAFGKSAATVVAPCIQGAFLSVADVHELSDGSIRVRASQVIAGVAQYSVGYVKKDTLSPTLVEPRAGAVVGVDNYRSVLVRGRCSSTSQVRIDVTGADAARLPSLYVACEGAEFQTYLDLNYLVDGNLRIKVSLKADTSKYSYVGLKKDVAAMKLSPSPSRFEGALTAHELLGQKSIAAFSLDSIQAKDFADAALLASKAVPGTRIVLPSGEFTGVNALFQAKGEVNRPIVIEGAAGGATILKGLTALTLSGSYLLLRNIVIQDPDAFVHSGKGSLIYVDACKLCGINNLKITGSPRAMMNAEKSDLNTFKYIRVVSTSKKVEIFGNSFIDKKNAGSIILIERAKVWTGTPDGHRIFNNLFSGRELQGHSANDFDMIRIGDGSTCHAPSKAEAETYLQENAALSGTTIEFNVFENGHLNAAHLQECKSRSYVGSACSAEPEIISIKAPHTIIRFNTFRNNYGGLTIRQGYQDIIEGNYFSGDNRPAGIAEVNRFSAGVRVTGDSHLVMHNHLENLMTENRMSGGIALVAGQENAGASGYWQVESSLIAFNHIQNVSLKPLALAADYGSTKVLPPQNSVISNNSFLVKGEALVSDAPNGDYFSKIIFKDNLISNATAGFSKKFAKGLAIESPLVVPWGFSTPSNLELTGSEGILRSSLLRHAELLSALGSLVKAEDQQRLKNLLNLLLIKNGTLYERYIPQAPHEVGAAF